ncbi:MAG: hypothetical protein WKF88_09790 [Ferruginibacter sp.]
MKVLSSKAHGILDYLFSVFILLTPTLFHLGGRICTVIYVLGAVHLLLTILTDFEVGLVKMIPFRIHGLIEMAVSLALLVIAFVFYQYDNEFGFYYFLSLAGVVLIVFIISDFTGSPERR